MPKLNARFFFSCFVFSLILSLFACSSEEADPVCMGVDCGEHGVCSEIQGQAVCLCDAGYVAEGLSCVPEETDPCLPNPCTGMHEVCEADGLGGYDCVCADGYRDEAGVCVPDMADACDPNPCSGPYELCQVDGQGGFDCVCEANTSLQEEVCQPDCLASSDICLAAHRSASFLVSANGHSAVVYERAERKTNGFLEHLYRNWDEDVHTRDLLFDSFLGLRSAGGQAWLNEASVELVREEYLADSGIIHLVHRLHGFLVDTYTYAPWQLSRPALVLLGRVTRETSVDSQVSLYSLHNYHLGYTDAVDPVNPDARDEEINHDASSGAYVEKGIGGVLLHRPLGPVSHHACTPDNPWQALSNGQDLADTAASGLGEDRVAGFQRDFDLAPGQSGWFGVVTAFERDADVSVASLLAELDTAYGGDDAEATLEAALAEWAAWRNPAPSGLSPAERKVYRQSEAVLRMGQVLETRDLSHGQIVASMPPGMWNICWMRDMAYAIMGFLRSGHHAEARAALEFVLRADSGTYEASHVGLPYQVTITRYFGRGKEETDFNADGPNIEYDGFGLFLWVLGEYVKAIGDGSLLDDHWSTVDGLIADALVGLRDEETGMIVPDSSIWEVHWDGMQKRFSYTSLAAARGLCQVADMASTEGMDTEASLWSAAGLGVQDAIDHHCLDVDGAIASSVEEWNAGSGYRDMAVVEALNWLLFDPTGAVATATLDTLEASQRVASGFGYFRNDDGGWYDNQEWVFVDLRASVANRLAGRAATADALLDWITAQAQKNFGMIAELHTPDSSDYEGEVPMVGFGAGAWILALHERETPRIPQPVCGTW
ncbi:MAG: hypothetical protein JRF33_23925 [Deltaproteobacteria bacterium]|nr:hypothetical protein [Deltaproteobacteria bacterium]